MRLRFLFAVGSVSCLLIGATFACSSSAPAAAVVDAGKKDTGPAPVQETPPVEETPEEEPPPAEETPTDGGTEEGGSTGDGGTPTPQGDSGTPTTTYAADSLKETEPNNDVGTATNLNTPPKTFSFCGVTSGQDPDVFTFKTPAYNQNFQICPNQGSCPGLNQVQVSGSVNGNAFNGINSNFGNVNDGDTWVVRIAGGGGGGGGGGGAGRAYRITFVFN